MNNGKCGVSGLLQMAAIKRVNGIVCNLSSQNKRICLRIFSEEFHHPAKLNPDSRQIFLGQDQGVCIRGKHDRILHASHEAGIKAQEIEMLHGTVLQRTADLRITHDLLPVFPLKDFIHTPAGSRSSAMRDQDQVIFVRRIVFGAIINKGTKHFRI